MLAESMSGITSGLGAQGQVERRVAMQLAADVEFRHHLLDQRQRRVRQDAEADHFLCHVAKAPRPQGWRVSYESLVINVATARSAWEGNQVATSICIEVE